MTKHKEEATKQLTYFAMDGNYGDAVGITVIDTRDWTDADFTMFDQVSDEQRPLLARVISEWIESDRSDDYNQYFERLGVDLH
jgi:hypothetical protein